MRRVVFCITFVLTAAVAFIACRKQLVIPAITNNANILVVEGLINIGADSTKIKLSRTVTIGNKKTANPEANALVTVESAQAILATLKQTALGTYVSAGLNLAPGEKYRLRIRTYNGKTYLSDLVEAKVTPPIDSVGYTIKGNGIQVYVNSHDDSNNSRYYFYNYAETWKFGAKYGSYYVTNGKTIEERTLAQEVFYCFNSASSVNVVINNTASLSKDVTYQFPVTTVDGSSEKISIKYSVLVTQTALTKDAYAFWENLRKNTEQLGSIFDAQPSMFASNIHNINDVSEPVIGYVSAATTQSKRLFIDKKELPLRFITKYPYECEVDTAYHNTERGVDEVADLLIPLASQYNPIVGFDKPPFRGYIYTTKLCSDCTLRGTTHQPVFWK